MILTGKTEVLGETPVPVSLCPPQQKKTTEEHATSFSARQDKLQTVLNINLPSIPAKCHLCQNNTYMENLFPIRTL
jgi:hypothetical protein